ncbi:hypothetical protein TWF506_003123 [Arthrobotrys conoides]|uniref:Uncharacterized protein n=1 Tax=Arthrobotrys conoides TaxID=74498 RepID=A0AAN8RKX0_9PEZI
MPKILVEELIASGEVPHKRSESPKTTCGHTPIATEAPSSSEDLLEILAKATGTLFPGSKELNPTAIPHAGRVLRYRRRYASSLADVKRDTHHDELPQTNTLSNVIQTTLVPGTRPLPTLVRTPQTLSHSLPSLSPTVTAPMLSPRGPLVTRDVSIYIWIFAPIVPVLLIVAAIVGWFVYKKKKLNN